ncbi:MAG: PilZ domain-containing protein [Gammaproteobacteria bacterium]|nr:PilZ domain-containing protein [Gammaproteobacteria bacterium]
MEKRWNERCNYELNIQYSANGRLINLKTSNISMGGMFLNLLPGISEKFPRRFEATIVDDSHLVRCKLGVVRHEAQGIAVQFLDYSNNVLELLHRKLYDDYGYEHTNTSLKAFKA